MVHQHVSAAAFSDTKPHYEILDGLRGVAALIVIVYHVFECFDWSPAPHGYLAVDFFFVLSGFVIGYAYDDRWQKEKGHAWFFRRRLIRLHPMVVMGALIGAICFLLQGSVRWDGTSVSTGWVMLAMLMGMLMLPLWPGAHADVRGNGEMFPLNGPNWSLFFEYIGNILYALLLRRLSTMALACIAAVTGCLLMVIALQNGYLGVGWSMVDGGFWSGLVRMLFPYSVGMLIARIRQSAAVPRIPVATSLLGGAIMLAVVACLPLVLGNLQPWLGGLYDALCVIVVFPLIVWSVVSAADKVNGEGRLCRFLGDLSYPLYAIHYPLMYLFYAHIGFQGDLVPIGHLAETWPAAIATALGSILLGWLCMRFYDLPVRRWLMGTFSHRKQKDRN